LWCTEHGATYTHSRTGVSSPSGYRQALPTRHRTTFPTRHRAAFPTGGLQIEIPSARQTHLDYYPVHQQMSENKPDPVGALFKTTFQTSNDRSMQ